MQSSRSKATRKYEEKAGWISRSYKLKKEVVEEFKAACEKAGVSQAGQLMKMMQGFIAEQKDDTRDTADIRNTADTRNTAEEIASDEEVLAVSEKLIEKNRDAYEELAK